MENMSSAELPRKGYIYVRTHSAYDEEGACKLGKASNIPERDSQYATGEIKRGRFILVIELETQPRSAIAERCLQREFEEYHLKYNGGTEFYSKCIIPLIEPCLTKYNIPYKKLTEQEVDNLVRCNRVRKTFSKINIPELIKTIKSRGYIPREYQTEIINTSVEYYQRNEKGLLVLMCGVGKTLISLWISQRLDSNTILIGVPNVLLLNQWIEITNVLLYDFPQALLVSGDMSVEKIIRFLRSQSTRCVVITTYASSYKVLEATQSVNFTFSVKILDEAHHLTTKNMDIAMKEDTRAYVKILEVLSNKQIALTATTKILESMGYSEKENSRIVSNDSLEYFGNTIDIGEKSSLLWAIRNNIVCDYVVQTIITNEEQHEEQLARFNIVEENDKRLFLSAFASLKSICDRHSHHLLIYANNTQNSSKIVNYIGLLLEEYFTIPDLYYSEYNSDKIEKDQKKILQRFEKSSYGIITCVYCLGEGWDFPLLDGVVFAENMTSNIRILQSALRASRKSKEDPNKKTKIILPVLNKHDWLDNMDNQDWRKVREVIYQMGLEDETIQQKIKVFRIGIESHKTKVVEKENRVITNVEEFGEYDEDLTNNLRLRTMNRTVLGISYEKARQIIREKRITNKEAYYDLCEKDNRLVKNPEEHFKGKFTNWIEYLSIERVYYDLETCKTKVEEYLKQYPELKTEYTKYGLSQVCSKLCNFDNKFPPNELWVEYYKIENPLITELKNIITITIRKKRTGAVI